MRRFPGIFLFLLTLTVLGAGLLSSIAAQKTDAAGSPYDYAAARTNWAFQTPKNPAVPKVKNKNWPQSPIDNFILAKLEEKKLNPAGDTSKQTLIRRVTFDLVGLPPTPEEIENFLADKSTNALAKVVDRLLASSHYGERWGRHWLDVAHYADTSGCNSDYPIPAAHKYRDYVIASFNRDKPYDEFVREQIAGDLLPAATDEKHFEQIIATGYLAISRRFSSGKDEFHLTIEDTIDTVGKGILGLSVSCARCHDHKFDPIPTKDYYALYGIFESTRYAFPGAEVFWHPKDFVPLVKGAPAEELVKYQTALAALDDQIFEWNNKLRPLEAVDKDGKKNEEHAKLSAAVAEATEKMKKLEANPVAVPVAYAVGETKSADAKIQKKGDPKNLGEIVPRGFLQVLGGQTLPTQEKGSGRLELAQWLTDPKNPLTARVMVNRIWQHHFGRGLVATPNDFGKRGTAPTHPELLDFLATKFVESGWSVKAMHKLMVLSRAYQMSSEDNLKNAARDVNNDWLWHFNPRRLDAEEIRDAMLVVSGTLDETPAGPHPFPPEKEWRYTQHTPFLAVYPTHKRSVYLMQQRIKKHPFLETFDGADTNGTVGERPVSTTALQALFMMNDPFAHEQAEKFAARLAGILPTKSAQIEGAYRLAFGRTPTPDEIRSAEIFVQQCEEQLAAAKNVTAEQRPRAALASYCRVLLSSSEFMFVD
ncbi:MAG: DUF1549 and DUF1553 domain-containing protein [Verrucomicrobiota bacterium]